MRTNTLVVDGKTGFTFEPGNARDLVEKILVLLTNDSLIAKIGENAKKFVTGKFNPERYYQKL